MELLAEELGFHLLHGSWSESESELLSRLFVIPIQSMEFSRPEYWGG